MSSSSRQSLSKVQPCLMDQYIPELRGRLRQQKELRVVLELFFSREQIFSFPVNLLLFVSGSDTVRDRGMGRKTSKESVYSLCERRNLVMQREEKGRDIATHRLIERKGKC